MNIPKGEGNIKTRKVAFLVNEGVSKESVDALKPILEKEGAEVVLISSKVGTLKFDDGSPTEIKNTFLTDPSVLYDAVYTPAGSSGDKLLSNPDYFEFIKDAYRHGKALAFAKDAEKLIERSFVGKDRAVIETDNKNWVKDFISVLKEHRIWDREGSRKVPS